MSLLSFSACCFLKGIEKLTIEAAHPAKPPLFVGGANAWQFSRCAGLTLRNLACRGQTGNGFNLDDGGPDKGDVPGITLENLSVSEIGPDGNCDGIKCSGLAGLTIRGCTVEGWGGQAIDLVGCHRVLITGCRILGKPGFSQHTGPQFKGGCEDIVIEKCSFIEAGGRPIEAGGSTGMDSFQPLGAKYEARRITPSGITVSKAATAPARSQELMARSSLTTASSAPGNGFSVSSRKPKPTVSHQHGTSPSPATHSPSAATINIGPGTALEPFKFVSNTWYAEDKPEDSNPRLTVPETGGIYGRKPEQ